MEIETSNNHLTEESSKLMIEFDHCKEREKLSNKEVERLRTKIDSVEEENRSLQTQLRDSLNANQLTQVYHYFTLLLCYFY